MKTNTLYAVLAVLALGLCFTGVSFASDDKGPAEMTLESTIDKAKKAIFNHAKHQETMTCGDCHHSKDADGKQVAYVEGQKVEKCESCHNKAAGIDAAKKLSTFKQAAHANCKACHKAKDKELGTPKDKALAKCTVCHPKKK